MADESTMEPGSNEGQSVEGPETTTLPGPGEAEGQSLDSGTTETGPQENATVFDPGEFTRLTEGLSPELQAQAKALQANLQGAYTKKFQGISESRKKIEAYDAFNADPVGQIEKLAKQMGYNFAPAGANNQPQPTDQEWEPQSWGDVMQRAKQEILSELNPVLSEVQNIKKNSIESQLTEIDPTWKQYESDMMETMKAHPTLAKDPAMLYRMSVPKEVSESRAVQRAMAKMKAKVDGGQVSGSSTTTKTPKIGLPDKPVSFAEAVAAAQKKLADDGIRLT